jgi:hypothetical protein
MIFLLLASFTLPISKKDLTNTGRNIVQQKIATKESIDTNLKNNVIKKINNIKNWGPKCDFNGLKVPAEGKIGNQAGCTDGDFMALHGGHLCLAGMKEACEGVKKSVSSTGQLFRSPLRVNKEEHDASSRDQFIGFLMYLIATKDQDLAKLSFNYLSSNGKLCPKAGDTKCNLNPSVLSLYQHAWEYIGLGQNPWIAKTGGMAKDTYYSYLLTAASSSPLGYQLDLVVRQGYLLKKMGVKSKIIDNALSTAFNRDPENVWFNYNANGLTNQVIKQLNEQVPEKKPTSTFQWSIQRKGPEKAWKDSSGWEFLFLGKEAGLVSF